MRLPLLTLLSLVSAACLLSAQTDRGGTDSGTGGGADGGEGGDTAESRGLLDGADGMVAPANYRIQPSDVVYVQIFQQRDLNKEARVEADGTITLHLIGRVNVEGLTVGEAREKITELYNRDFLVNPQIDLQVVQFNLDKVQVLGQVRKPGLVGIPPDEDLTLLRAISQAGGFTRLARKGSVQIRRELEDGETKVFVVNASDLISDPDSEDFILRDGDIIFIEERII